jgi:hypothetical protein
MDQRTVDLLDDALHEWCRRSPYSTLVTGESAFVGGPTYVVDQRTNEIVAADRDALIWPMFVAELHLLLPKKGVWYSTNVLVHHQSKALQLRLPHGLV